MGYRIYRWRRYISRRYLPPAASALLFYYIKKEERQGYKNNTMKLGYQVSLEFVITQHIKDKDLMEKFITFFLWLWVLNKRY